MLQAIHNNHLLDWPGLTIENVNKYLDETPATAKGHLDQHRMNIKSTKITSTEPIGKFRTNQTIATIIDNTKLTKAYFDLTGPFPYVSTRGYKYIFVLYDYDSNAILTAPLQSRSANHIQTAWLNLHLKLNDKGLFPSMYIMDNEAASDIKQAILKHKLNYQLTPPNIHRINAAEGAIRTFKNHFIAGLASVNPTFPINKWD